MHSIRDHSELLFIMIFAFVIHMDVSLFNIDPLRCSIVGYMGRIAIVVATHALEEYGEYLP